MKYNRLLLASLAALLLMVFSTPLFVGRVAAQERQFATPIVVVNTSALNVRSGPGAQFSVLYTVPGGAELPVLAIDTANVWYLVGGPFGAGWISQDFVLPRGDFTRVPVYTGQDIFSAITNRPSNVGLPRDFDIPVPVREIQLPEVLVNTSALNVRSGPGSVFTILYTVPGGFVFEPLGVTADQVWVLVDSPLGRGWIAREFIVFRGDVSTIPVLVDAY